MKTTLRWCFAVFVMSASLTSCERNIVDPSLSAVTQRITPPVVYRKWWAQTEACSGLKGNFNNVKWYDTPETTLLVDGENANAYWSSGSNRIVLTKNVEMDGQIVRHEMLHALIKGQGAEHPREQFLGKCRGVVHCNENCVHQESANSHYPLWKRMPAESLTIDMLIDPAQPSPAIDDGFFQVIIEVRNARAEQVVINIPAPFQGFAPVAFATSFGGTPTGGVDVRLATDFSAVAFEPGETKREVFDYRLAGTPQRPAFKQGQYHIGGKYGSLAKAPLVVNLPGI